ncbi:cysteine desulfurase [Patescibacteria group bacterium]|nr:cysteine desulfurase [Patescibacteria group bacterium]
MKKYYFDYASTTPVDSKVVNAMKPCYSGIFGNPGSIHRFGQEASAIIFKSRNSLAKLIGCDYREVIFTGSATEANNLALRGTLKALIQNLKIKNQNDNLKIKNNSAKRGSEHSRPRIITSAIEHESVLETCRDLEEEGLAEIVYLPVSKSGIVDLKKLKTSLNERTVLVSIMYANNEIGAIQPLFEISKIINDFKKRNFQSSITPDFIEDPRQGRDNFQTNSKKGETHNDQKNWELGIGNWELGTMYPLFHTDAVQAFNYLDCDVGDLGVDMMSLSSQKIYGPKGVGCLYVKNFGGFRGNKFISSIITGGGQEEGLRSGTENVPGIVGFSKAIEIAFNLREIENKRLKKLQEYFWVNINPTHNLCGGIKKRFSKIVLNGPKIGVDRLPNNINIYLQKNLIFKLDLAGFAVSGGSACSARLAKPSHVLRAMGCSIEKSSESVRISFGRQTTKQEVDRLLKVMHSILK